MKLLFPNGEHAQVELDNGAYPIGSASNAKIVLLAPGILPNHCELQFSNGNGMLAPASGDAVVSLNGVRITRSTEFKSGDLIQLADVRVRVVSVDKAVAPGAAVPVIQKRHDANEDDGRTKLRAALPKFMLRGVSGPTFGKVFALTGVTVIGRQPDCDISIPSDEISRRHAELRVSQDGVMVEDLGSANGTYVNEKRVTRELLKHGDELRFDQLRFQLVAPGKEMLHTPLSAGNANNAASSSPAPSAQAASSSLPVAVWVVLGIATLAVLLAGLKFYGVF